MTWDLAHLLPEAKTWVKSLVTIWPAPIIKGSSWMFPAILCGHILSLTVLGGAILLPSLRLIGVGMTEQSSASIEKTMRPWLMRRPIRRPWSDLTGCRPCLPPPPPTPSHAR